MKQGNTKPVMKRVRQIDYNYRGRHGNIPDKKVSELWISGAPLVVLLSHWLFGYSDWFGCCLINWKLGYKLLRIVSTYCQMI